MIRKWTSWFSYQRRGFSSEVSLTIFLSDAMTVFAIPVSTSKTPIVQSFAELKERAHSLGLYGINVAEVGVPDPSGSSRTVCISIVIESYSGLQITKNTTARASEDAIVGSPA